MSHILQILSFGQLLRAYIVLRLCQWPLLVRNSEAVFRGSTKVFGAGLVNSFNKVQEIKGSLSCDSGHSLDTFVPENPRKQFDQLSNG
jgi:hypothetical protein